MNQVICTEPGSMKISERAEIPATGSGHIILRIERVGICGTDFHAFKGRQPFFQYPRILGHELSATVESGTNTFEPGERVAVIPYLHCGQCHACKKALTNCCSELKVLGVHIDGGMQQFISIPEQYLMSVEDLSADQTALIEPLAVGYHGVRRSGLGAEESALVIGAGPIGLATAFFARQTGASVFLSDASPKKLEIGGHMLPDVELVAPSGIRDRLNRELSDLADVVFDATGNVEVMEQLPKYIAHGGRIVLVGLTRKVIGFSHPEIHAKEASIFCSRNATRSDFTEVVSCLKSGDFPAQSYITLRAGWSEIPNLLKEKSDNRESMIKIVTEWS